MKAVLVIDVEEQGDYYADVYRKDADDRFEGRYYLKPFPQKMTMEKALKMERVGAIKDIYTTWDACLDEIIGETE